MKNQYAIQIVWSKEDEAYIATPFELAGCAADGATPEEALENLKVVISEWIEVAKEEGRKIPEPMSREDFERVAEESEKLFRENLQREVSGMIISVLQQRVNASQEQGVLQRYFGGAMHSRLEIEPAGSGRR
jgi:predicted RNase H-like HicB family nuclease